MANSLFDIAGQVAVVTGGTGVLGSAMCRALAAHGAHVAVLGRSQERGEAVVRQLAERGSPGHFVQVDVTDRASCEAAALEISDRWGKIDILVNSAGGNIPQATTGPDQEFFDLPPDALRQAMDLNFLGTLLPCQVFGRMMAQQGVGAIVNISSMAAIRPLTKIVGYSAAKAAVSNLTAWLSVYLCEQTGAHLRVNAIAPGFFLTQQNRFLLTEEQSGELTPRGQQIIDHTPMRRFGSPDDLAGTLLWLVSPASAFVTGIVVPVDGGFSAFGGV